MKFFAVFFALSLGVELEAENIKFANAAVKTLCVSYWDVNKDGELSEEEAAMVTSLGEVFRERTDIGQFPELRYFTGLTAIDDYAFYMSSVGPELAIPGNVRTIGHHAFHSCQKLCRIYLNEGVEAIGYCAFSGPISYLSLPSSLNYLDSSFINPYINGDPGSGMFVPVGDLTVMVNTENPPVIHNFAFYYIFGNGHLIVPFGSKETYKTASGWQNLGEYIEVGDVNRDGRVDVADLTLLIAYIGGREHTDMDARIADINGDGVLDGEDVSLLCQYLLGPPHHAQRASPSFQSFKSLSV